jgi:hypothetical protein
MPRLLTLFGDADMSTKIYDAFKYKGDASTLMQYLINYRSKWNKYQIERLSQLVEDAFAHNPKNEDLFFEGKLHHSKLMDRIQAESKKEMKSWSDIFDVSAEVAIYFHKKKIYIQTFLNDRNAPKFVNDDMVDYHYQNQTDPWYDYQIYEGKMKESERAKWARDYRQRKKVWNEIYPDGISTAAQAGMGYSFGKSFGDFYDISIEVYKNWCRNHNPTAGILKEK